jgi:hypothetical protein
MKLTKTEIKAVLNMAWDIQKGTPKSKRTSSYTGNLTIEEGFLYITDGFRGLKIKQKELGLSLSDGSYTLSKRGGVINFNETHVGAGLTKRLWDTLKNTLVDKIIELDLSKVDKIKVENELVKIDRPIKHKDLEWIKLFNKSTITVTENGLPIIITNHYYEALVMPLKVA